MEVFTRQFDIYDDVSAGVSPEPSVFTAGTFSGNPLTMAAGKAVVTYMRDHPEIYQSLSKNGTRLAEEVNEFCQREEIPGVMSSALSLFYFRMQPGGTIKSVREINKYTLKEADDLFCLNLLDRGVIMSPMHIGYISAEHTPEDIDIAINAIKESLLEVRKAGLI